MRARLHIIGIVAVALLAGCSDETATGSDGERPSTTASGDDGQGAVRPSSPPDADAVTTPRVEGPVVGGKGSASLGPANFDLSTLGYQETELFLAGTATSYGADGPLTSDGMWTVLPAATAEYRTRIVVRRPVDPADFSGTVFVEWLNVSGGLDASPDWTYTHNELVRSGAAWVGVSAQAAGVVGGGNPLGAAFALKSADPDRYASLVHPGDDYSYDIFSQAGAAVWFGDALGGLDPEYVIAVGESQSAFRLSTYVNAVAPTLDVYDGYLIHSRSGGGAPLAEGFPAPNPNRVRTDLDVPVLVFLAETDLVGDRLGAAAARQPDTDLYRSWEVAGTAHADAYMLGIGDTDDGSGGGDDALFAAMSDPPTGVYGGIIDCDTGVNTGPHTYVLRSAIRSLDHWVRTGEAPPEMPQLELDDAGEGYVLDEVGNAKGGVRTPQVDVPVAVLSGLGQSGAGFCGLFGTTVPLDAAALAQRYPDHDAFVAQWNEAVDRAVDAGALLEPDAEQLRRVAAASTVGT